MKQESQVSQSTLDSFRKVMGSPVLQTGEDRISWRDEPNRTTVLLNDQPIASYCYNSNQSKPYIEFLATPSGTILTRPIKDATKRDHPHHQGFFIAYGDVNGVDFWGNLKSTPQIRHIEFLEKEDGSDTPGFTARLNWVMADDEILLEERRSMLFSPIEGGYSIDVDITLTAMQDTVFGDTKEGFFAIRLADWLQEKGGRGRYYSASGKQGAQAIWGTQEGWVFVAGINGKQAAMLGIKQLPGSFNYPAFWHAREYGLFAANPIGQCEFKQAHMQNSKPQPMTLLSGQSLSFAFRVIVLESKIE